jgi:GMP synthase (glutamine-hydrolysing)
VKPFLLLATRESDAAAAGEYRAILRHSGLDATRLHHVRVDQASLLELDLDAYAGVLLGGSSFNAGDEVKSDLQERVEADLHALLRRIVADDVPFLGLCYGIGLLTAHLGGTVDGTFGEPVGAVEIQVTAAGRADPLLACLPPSFFAFVGHKEARTVLPVGAEVLAVGSACPVQAYRVGRHVYVTQFHPELDVDDLVERMRLYRHAGYFAPDELDALAADARTSPVDGAQHELLTSFVRLFG